MVNLHTRYRFRSLVYFSISKKEVLIDFTASTSTRTISLHQSTSLHNRTFEISLNLISIMQYLTALLLLVPAALAMPTANTDALGSPSKHSP